tara:strand:- start:1337 stop:1600 length:264 start_codon:yes stop_codon:yes gene_type:complete
VVLSATKRGQSRLTREEFVAATKYVESRADFAWSMHKLVEGAFWVDASGDEMIESVAGGKPGIMGKFKGRRGTVMPREFLVEDEKSE